MSTEVTNLPDPILSSNPTELRSTILTLLEISDPAAASDEETFWRLVAERHGVKPAVSSVETARAVLAALDIPWDEDFVEEDGESVTVTALETFQAKLETLAQREAGDEGDDEDASLSWNWGSFKLSATKSDLPVRFLVSEIREGNLVVNPEWQRGYVWSADKQRRLIESILLGLPIPSFLFHADSNTQKTYVVDGRQRLETLTRFKSPKPRRGKGLRFKTFDVTEEGWKPGQPLHAAAGKYYEELPPEFKTKVDGATMVINSFTDLPPGALYQIFKRYNTGAVALKAQEIRNAVYQASPLHQMMHRVAGENESGDRYLDARERDAGTTLRQTMGKQKQRYGAYAFVGRFFAFRHMSGGSVAMATNDFMERYERASDAQVETFRCQYLDAFEATQRWYRWPFVKSEEEPKWHAFFAALQLVSSSVLLDDVAAGTVTDEQVHAAVEQGWDGFAEEMAEQKQNAKLFWGAQRTWVATLRSAVGLVESIASEPAVIAS